MVDLCVGPHIPHTGKIKAFMVTKVCISLPCKFNFHQRNLSRTRLHTSLAILTTILFNVSMGSPSQTKSNWRNTKCSLLKLPSVITVRSAKSKNFSSSMIWAREVASSCHTEQGYTTPWWSWCESVTFRTYIFSLVSDSTIVWIFQTRIPRRSDSLCADSLKTSSNVRWF